MLYCQRGPGNHRAAAVYALTLARSCGHEYPSRVLACLQHGEELRAHPRSGEPSPCERCAEEFPLTLVAIEDVTEEKIVVTLPRFSVENSMHSPVTLAYDRACQLAAQRGLVPVSTYRVPVQWSSTPDGRTSGSDLLEASVTLAVTLREQPRYRAG